MSKYLAPSGDQHAISKNAQHNLKIAQIHRMRESMDSIAMSIKIHTDLLIHEGCLDAIKGHIPWSEVTEELEEQLPLFREALAWTPRCFIVLPVVMMTSSG